MIVKKLIVFLSTLFSVIYSDVVYRVPIGGVIDLGLPPYIKRVIKEAEDSKVKAIIFEINTFGGRVDAATQIKDAILSSNVQTIGFINRRAISAGALISLSCEKIYMTGGGLIGAATAVDMSGNTLSTISSATHGLSGIYGMAYDDFTIGGPYLWAFDQGGNDADIVQLDMQGNPTGVVHDANSDLNGGGISGQADALSLGISRALIKMDPSFRKKLKTKGLLTRDSRVKESKKYGLKRARKAQQFTKR